MTCCSEIQKSGAGESPFLDIIGLGYYDGILSGLAKCEGCSREFRFENLDEDLGGEVRVVSLAALPDGSMQDWCSEVWRPRPIPARIWVADWTWPSPEITAAKTEASDVICNRAEHPRWVVAWKLSEPMQILRWLDLPRDSVPRDWFEYCGLQRPQREEE
jgi:hypothetical protein